MKRTNSKRPPTQIDSLTPALKELERALEWASRDIDTITTPVVPVIQTRGKKFSCAGWFAPDRWRTREGEARHEITFCAETLDRTPEEIVSTAIHETVHLWCHQLGILDVSKGGRHNKKFREYAEIMGLECSAPSDSKGYAYTHPGAELMEQIDKDFQPDVAAFNLFRESEGIKPKAANKTVAYSCLCSPARTFRAKPDLKGVHCEYCEEEFAQN